jgi:hypothetical protein
MIINYPTGLYNLFGSLEVSPNVTWYISNNAPPRSNDVVIKIPDAEELRPLPSPEIDRKTRRQTFGDLIYTISEAANNVTASSMKAYSEGDILDFKEDNREDISVPRGDRVEFRHDLNELDLSGVGLDDEDISQFNSSVYDKKEELEEQFLILKTDINDIEIAIKEIQKRINESNKALNAVTILQDQELEEKITAKKDGYEASMDELVQSHEEKTQEVAVIVNELFTIDMVAK